MVHVHVSSMNVNIFVEVVNDKVKLQFFVVFMSFFIDLNFENKYFIKVFLVLIPLLVLDDQIESDDLLLVLEKAIIVCANATTLSIRALEVNIAYDKKVFFDTDGSHLGLFKVTGRKNHNCCPNLNILVEIHWRFIFSKRVLMT